MLKDVLTFIDTITVIQVLCYWAVLLVLEKFVIYLEHIHIVKGSLIYFNLWEVFGLFFPVIWLLRHSQGKVTYFDLLVVIAMSVYYGIFKPMIWRKQRMKDK